VNGESKSQHPSRPETAHGSGTKLTKITKTTKHFVIFVGFVAFVPLPSAVSRGIGSGALKTGVSVDAR
jgi:hypothetical protein